MKNVCGIFETRESAEKALAELLAAGLQQGQVSLIMSDATRDKLKIVGRDEAGEASKGAVTGAALGGALTALVAGAIAVGTLAVPGTTLLVAGPLAAVLSGGAVGMVAGGLVGALVNAGMPQDEAEKYEEAIKRGKALLVVHPETEEQATLARSVIIDSGALTAAA